MERMAEDGKTEVSTGIAAGTTAAEAADPTGQATRDRQERERLEKEKGKRMADGTGQVAKHSRGESGKGKGATATGSTAADAPMSNE
jgi:GTP cyclohydrolase III